MYAILQHDANSDQVVDQWNILFPTLTSAVEAIVEDHIELIKAEMQHEIFVDPTDPTQEEVLEWKAAVTSKEAELRGSLGAVDTERQFEMNIDEICWLITKMQEAQDA